MPFLIRWLLCAGFLWSTASAATIAERARVAVGGQFIACPAPVKKLARCFQAQADVVDAQQQIERQLAEDIWLNWGLAGDGKSLGLVARTYDELNTLELRLPAAGNQNIVFIVAPITPIALANGEASFTGGEGQLVILNRLMGVYVTVINSSGALVIDWSKLTPGEYTAVFSAPGQVVRLPFHVGSGPSYMPMPSSFSLTENNILDAPSDTMTMLLDRDQHGIAEVSDIKDDSYQLLVARPGFMSTVVPVTMVNQRMTPISMPTLQAIAQVGSQTTYGYGSTYDGSSGSGGPVFVHGYTRANGTYVAPYFRSAPSRK